MSRRTRLEGAARQLMVLAATLGVFAFLSGCGAGEDSTANTTAARDAYRDYLVESAAAMNVWNLQLRNKVEAGQIEEAKARFAASQVPFGHLKPALTLSTLGEALLTPPDGVYPRIERLLWSGQTGPETVKAAREAIDMTSLLKEQLKTIDLSPPAVAGNGRRTIDEIAALDLGLEANPYSHIEVLNASANLEGVKAAFESIRPALIGRDAELPAEIEREMRAAFAALEGFGVAASRPKQPEPEFPGTTFVSGAQLTPEDLHPVHAPVKKLASLFNRSVKILLIPSTPEKEE